MGARLLASVATCLLLVACNRDEPRPGGRAQGEDSLPAPGAVSGSVTGMPDPGRAAGQPPLAAPPSAIQPGDDIDGLAAIDGSFEPVAPAGEDVTLDTGITEGGPPPAVPPLPQQVRAPDPWTGQPVPVPSEPVEPAPPRQ